MSNVKEMGRLVERMVAEDHAEVIRSLRHNGVPRSVIAEAFGLTPARISQIAPATAATPDAGAHQPDCAGHRRDA